MDNQYLNVEDVRKVGEHNIKGYVQNIFNKNNKFYYFKLKDFNTTKTMFCCLHYRKYSEVTLQNFYNLENKCVNIQNAVIRFTSYQIQMVDEENNEENEEYEEQSEFMAFVDPCKTSLNIKNEL
ncbi:Hypothetical_protein [Hexamita inflata]|uniref:Hypothetical_protein n=1 Tax=Hexamita inflata TaxID=28002 RepID=A0AA86NMB8_9EUKA|nr:Hypothetical protein HINF_LOCUS9201 [Hexamita inflata]